MDQVVSGVNFMWFDHFDYLRWSLGWRCSSVIEYSSLDLEVPGSVLGAPLEGSGSVDWQNKEPVLIRGVFIWLLYKNGWWVLVSS